MRLLSVILALAFLVGSLAPAVAQDQTTDSDLIPNELSVEPEATPIPTAIPSPTAAPPAVVSAPSEADVAAQVVPSVVRIVAGTSGGSGVKIDRGVLTNEHVVSGAARVEVVTRDGTRSPATVARTSKKYDLALLLTEAPLPALEFEAARDQRQGDTVLALGYPRTDALGSGQATLTRGLISAIREDKDGVLYVQTDAALNAGSSGGALVNMRGKLIGISSASVRDSELLGLAVATESIQAFLTGPEEAPARTTALPRSPGSSDPEGSITGQTASVCEGALRLELLVEDAVMARDGTVHLLVRARNTGTETGNLLLKLRLNDNRNRSFNMVTSWEISMPMPCPI